MFVPSTAFHPHFILGVTASNVGLFTFIIAYEITYGLFHNLVIQVSDAMGLGYDVNKNTHTIVFTFLHFILCLLGYLIF